MGQLHTERVAGQAVPIQQMAQRFRKPGLGDLPPGQIDADAKPGHKLLPDARLLQSAAQHPLTHQQNVAGLLQNGDDLLHRHIGEGGIIPPQQRLRRGTAAPADIDLRLEHQRKIGAAIFHVPVQRGTQGAVMLLGPVHGVGVGADAAGMELLGLFQRGIGAGQQDIRAQAMAGIQHIAAGQVQRQCFLAHRQRPGRDVEPGKHCLQIRSIGVPLPVQEFVSLHAVQRAGHFQRQKPFGQRTQHPVAKGIAVGFVHAAKGVDAEQQQPAPHIGDAQRVPQLGVQLLRGQKAGGGIAPRPGA